MVKIIKVKAIVSILLFITFLVTLFSGIGLMISPRGKVANMTNWIFLGLDKWQLLKVFWERNKGKINDKSKTELKLPVEIDGFKFFGLADRVDTLEDGTVEIIDYKTNKKPIDKDKREIQLGFYALALQKLGYKVSKLTLDMLKLEKPVEFGLDSEGEVTSLNGREKGFTLQEVKEKIIELAKAIANDYEQGFECADDDGACRFCGYKFYCPKWDE